MKKKRPLNIKCILFDDHMASTRLWLSLGSFIWAVLLWWPGTLFIEYRTTYHLMAVVAPEQVWGTAFLIQGIWALYTLLCNVRNPASLVMDAALGCLLWTLSTILCFASHWPSDIPGFLNQLSVYKPPAAMSGEVLLSIASWWNLVRHWAEDCNCPPHKGFSCSD